VRGNASRLLSLIFVMSMLVSASVGHNWLLAIYALSFWHYYLYWLAYYFGAVPLDQFKGDAVLMKAVSLIALGYVYLAAPLDVASLVVVASGFLLNGVAAKVLGSDRTYYGYEVANLPPRQVTIFPYSWISHPMLVGNIAAFSGMLINADFRREWWPLACTHVAMNLGLLFMELAVTPKRRNARRSATGELGCVPPRDPRWTGCVIVAVGATLGATLGSYGTWNTESLFGVNKLFDAGLGASISAFAYVLYCCYSTPASLPDHPREIHREDSR
jgi:hypothetical protein